MQGRPNYDFFEQEMEGEGQFLIAKETIGHKTPEECTLKVFPDKESCRATRPCFIFRDPASTYGSWVALGWGSLESFITSYLHTFDLFQEATRVSGQASAIAHEGLVVDPETVLRQLCERWNLPYDDRLVNWNNQLGRDSPIQRWIHEGSSRGFEAEHHAKLRESTTFSQMESTVALPLDQMVIIRERLDAVYARIKDSPVFLKPRLGESTSTTFPTALKNQEPVGLLWSWTKEGA
ncbi:MAG: hypothetical protein WC924_02825 [Candidatus Gracilibacteria bacterium]